MDDPPRRRRTVSLGHEDDRNPSPPDFTKEEKEIIQSDFIGETLFSKKWVLSILLKSTKHTDYVNEGGEESKDDSSKDSKEREERENSLQQLDKDFEEQLCELWDMTMNNVRMCNSGGLL